MSPSKNDAPRPVTRRSFLKRTATLTAATVGFPMIVPPSALGREGSVAPNDRKVMGCIGVGNMGTGNMGRFLGNRSVQMISVCDVDDQHARNAQEIVNTSYDNADCTTHRDFRELLDQENLDAVMIAVPDHWHAITAIASANAGLDIYCEKPLALTIREGQAMVHAVRRNRVVWQTGSWQRSVSNFRRACQIVRNGHIGNVHTIKVGLPTGNAIEPQQAMDIPPHLDYDRWLGPAPDAPYTEKRVHRDFRWLFDYSGGQLTDWGAHHCDIANWGMGTEDTGPEEVEATGRFPSDGLWNTAIDYHVTATYGKRASSLAKDGFRMLISNHYPMGARFEGDNGWVYVSRSHFETSSPEFKETEPAKDRMRLYESRSHVGNFLECMDTRRDTVTPIEAAHRAISIAHLGNIAMRLRRKVKWDPEKEEIIDDPIAGRMLDRAKRGAWRLG